MARTSKRRCGSDSSDTAATAGMRRKRHSGSSETVAVAKLAAKPWYHGSDCDGEAEAPLTWCGSNRNSAAEAPLWRRSGDGNSAAKAS